MFCYQCQETAQGKGCTVAGVCGKKDNTANLQDELIAQTKRLAIGLDGKGSDIITFNLFMTITNANFDDEAIQAQIDFTKAEADKLTNVQVPVGVLAEENEDLRSLKELITYGLKGMAAYNKHAHALNHRNEEVDAFMSRALAKICQSLTQEDLINLVMETGQYGVQAMSLLDGANTGTYGNPEITTVNIGVRNNPAILISGHDLKDLEMLLEQTKGTGVDVYTHSEMLPAHYYPFFKKYDNLVGNYGNAWWKQTTEFETFNGPILFTTNCLVPPRPSYKDRVYTTAAVGFDGCPHIEADENGWKDFSAIIEHAKRLPAPTEIESGSIVGGFAHEQVFALADKIVEAVQTGAIKQFVVMGGCDGRQAGRNYYTDFAKALPQDAVILTAGCAKYRYNKLGLGDINGIPRVLDAGQCNDSYSLAMIALKLKEILGVADINELPIIYNIAWYEQKAVIVLLALLYLGVKNIHLGPTLPAFLSPNVVNFLVEHFGIAPIQTVEQDIEHFFPEEAGKEYNASMLMGEIIQKDPKNVDILMEMGMGCMGCPASQAESLQDACLVHGIDPKEVLAKLNGEKA